MRDMKKKDPREGDFDCKKEGGGEGGKKDVSLAQSTLSRLCFCFVYSVQLVL